MMRGRSILMRGAGQCGAMVGCKRLPHVSSRRKCKCGLVVLSVAPCDSGRDFIACWANQRPRRASQIYAITQRPIDSFLVPPSSLPRPPLSSALYSIAIHDGFFIWTRARVRGGVTSIHKLTEPVGKKFQRQPASQMPHFIIWES